MKDEMSKDECAAMMAALRQGSGANHSEKVDIACAVLPFAGNKSNARYDQWLLRLESKGLAQVVDGYWMLTPSGRRRAKRARGG
jgi:hypothetical protein